MATISKCSCPSCGIHVEFDASELALGEVRKGPCPSCGTEMSFYDNASTEAGKAQGGRSWKLKTMILGSVAILCVALVWVWGGTSFSKKTNQPQEVFEGANDAERAELDRYKTLVKTDANAVFKQDDMGRTPLFLAVGSGFKNVARFLIANSADVNARNKEGITPLHEAVWLDYPEIVELLLEKGADANARANTGNSPLHEVSGITNGLAIAKLLLAHGANINATNNEGQTLLIELAGSQSDLVPFLISSGADVKVSDKLGNTALHLAAKEGRLSVVEALVEKGSEIKTANKTGNTPLDLASAQRQKEVVGFLLGKLVAGKDLNVSVWSAFNGGDLDLVRYLIFKGANINARDAEGKTLLYLAVYGEDIPMVKMLLDQGANPQIKTDAGICAIHMAAGDEDTDTSLAILKLLLEKGADVNAKSDGGDTALMFAAVSKNIRNVDALLNHGASVTIKNDEGQTVMFKTKDVNIGELLLSHGADINSKDKKGWTPLRQSMADMAWLHQSDGVLNMTDMKLAEQEWQSFLRSRGARY